MSEEKNLSEKNLKYVSGGDGLKLFSVSHYECPNCHKKYDFKDQVRDVDGRPMTLPVHCTICTECEVPLQYIGSEECD